MIGSLRPLFSAPAFAGALGFYLYIGITSLCLYHSAAPRVLQAAIFHKKFRSDWCKTQKSLFLPGKRLTGRQRLWYAEYVGASEKAPLFAAVHCRRAMVYSLPPRK